MVYPPGFKLMKNRRPPRAWVDLKADAHHQRNVTESTRIALQKSTTEWAYF
tara:strand:+ start:669 stop:821 length:153 start_codon:yes stop_codon:yes gene_type:complete